MTTTLDLYLELDPRNTLDPRTWLIARYKDATKTVDYSGNQEQCGRCNRTLDVHEWRVINLGDDDLVRWQKGVLDCGILGEGR